MDTSKEYIEMCRQANEIQEKWKPEIGDVIEVIWKPYSSRHGLSGAIIQDRPMYGISYDGEWRYYNGQIQGARFYARFYQTLNNDPEFEGVIWLPRQDQLQAISLKKGRALAILLSVCLEIDYSNHREYFTESKFESMEQFWLAYVMFWNFKKLWDDTKKEWVME